MFTGFATENTPAIQVWDFTQTSSATNRVSLTDDCAPIQLFKTGQSTTDIQLYLPSCPIEGKVLTIINHRYASSTQKIIIRSSDSATFGSVVAVAELGVGGTALFYYSKNNISYGPTAGNRATGWSRLDCGSETAANYGSTIVGGQFNVASGSNSISAGGSFNVVNIATQAAIIGGGSNTISNNATNAVIAGGSSNSASATASSVVGGSTNAASALYATVVGGQNHTANSSNGAIFGGSYGDARSIIGNFVIPASVNPISNANGVQQNAILLLARQTTDATATVLTSNTSAAGTTNQIILPNNSAYTFQGTVIANVTGGGNTSGWKFEGVIKRGATAASTTLVAAVIPTVIAQDAGAAAWVVAVTADTTNGGIAVTCTGAAATTIRWVCRIQTTEVTY